MAEFDQDSGVLDAGSAPIRKLGKKAEPRKPDYVPTAGDADIVHEAYAKKQADLKTQLEDVQTQGRQKGYSKKELGDILDEK